MCGKVRNFELEEETKIPQGIGDVLKSLIIKNN